MDKLPALHVLSLPHTSTTWDFGWCAYTMKALKLARMMDKLGYRVYLYGSTESDFENTVPCVLAPPTNKVSYPEWTVPYFSAMNEHIITKMGKLIEPGDIICMTTGWPQKPVMDAFPENASVEYGIGYSGVCANFQVYESYAWMHAVYAYHKGHERNPEEHVGNMTGRFYDAVIPNYFEVDQFPKGHGQGNYLLFIGRMTDLKGWRIAVETAERTGLDLIMAGQYDDSVVQLPSHVTHTGMVGPEERAGLMGNARAVMVPTLYLEPFGGVNVEAQLCGTPVITTDWGGFPETVEQGKTGYRCRTMPEFEKAVWDVQSLNRQYIRKHAIATWSSDVIALQYDTYFKRLMGLSDGSGGFNAKLQSI
jgi:glycosyltransferase involved in cell wall biosynthesis